MDEAKVNALGRQPLDPELARIDALKTKTDLARHMGRMNMLNMTTLVGGFVDGDAQDPVDLRVLRVAERPRHARPRLLPEGRPAAEGVPDEVPRVRRQDADPRRPAQSRGRRPRRSSRSKPGWPACSGPTSRAATRSRPTTRSRSRICRSGSPVSTGTPGRRSSTSPGPRRSSSRNRATSRPWPRRSRRSRSRSGSRT